MERRGELLQIQTVQDAGEGRLQDLTDLYRFAEEQYIEVDRFPMEHGGSLSVPLPGGRYGIAIDPEKVRTAADEMVKLAHELGHCATGSFYNRYAARDVRQRHENRADKWAIRQFLTEQDLDEAIAGGCTEMWELAEHFGVTEDFIRKAVCWYTYGNLAVEEYMSF